MHVCFIMIAKRLSRRPEFGMIITVRAALKRFAPMYLQDDGEMEPPRNVHKLSPFIFSSICHEHCSQEIRDTVPVPLRRVRTTRSSTHPHPFQVSLPTSRTLSHKSSFIPRTCNLWNLLLSSCFPESYNLPSFKSKINKLDLISLSS